MVMWGSGYDESGSGTLDNITTFDSPENTTLSCVARNIQGPARLPLSTTSSFILRASQALFYLFLLVSGTFLNSLVIVLVAKYKKLHSQSFAVAVQVMVLNLLLMLVIVISLINVLANQWLFGEIMCSLVGAYTAFTFTVRSLLLFLLVVDQFLAIFWTFAYPKYRKKVLISFSIASWVFSLSGIIPSVLDCFTFKSVVWTCNIATSCHEACNYFFAFMILAVLSPSWITPVILYMTLFFKAWKTKEEIEEITQDHKKDWKATVTFFLLFASVFVVTLPNVTIILILDFLYDEDTFPPTAHVLSAVTGSLVFLLLITDPILMMRNGEIRDILTEIKHKMLNQKIAPENMNS